MTPLPSRRLWWLFVAGAFAVLAFFGLDPGLFRAIGVNHYGVWFLDIFAILASNDALARGFDPYLPNPLDYFHRPHGYSHWWLELGRLGLRRGDYLWLGFVIVAVFFIAVIARLRLRQPGELVWTLAIFCAPPILLAVDRANNDLIIFVVLAPVVPLLLAERPAVRLWAIPLIAVASLLKAYPLVAGLVLLAGVRPRDVRWQVLAAALVYAAMAWDLVVDLPRYRALLPAPVGLMTLGGLNLFLALGAQAVAAKLLALAAAAVVVILFLHSQIFAGWNVAPADRGEWLGFVLGAALLAGCFLAGSSFAYRWVFALWLAPMLWRLPRDLAAPAPVRRLAALTAGLLLFVVWSDGLASAVLGCMPPDAVARWAERFFFAEQPVEWLFFACLLGFLAQFARAGCRMLFARG